MPRDPNSFLASDFPDVLRKIRARTPARILAGRAGAAYRTSTQLELREAHAAARDAVRAELDLESVFYTEGGKSLQKIVMVHQHLFPLNRLLGKRCPLKPTFIVWVWSFTSR